MELLRVQTEKRPMFGYGRVEIWFCIKTMAEQSTKPSVQIYFSPFSNCLFQVIASQHIFNSSNIHPILSEKWGRDISPPLNKYCQSSSSSIDIKRIGRNFSHLFDRITHQKKKNFIANEQFSSKHSIPATCLSLTSISGKFLWN